MYAAIAFTDKTQVRAMNLHKTHSEPETSHQLKTDRKHSQVRLKKRKVSFIDLSSSSTSAYLQSASSPHTPPAKRSRMDSCHQTAAASSCQDDSSDNEDNDTMKSDCYSETDDDTTQQYSVADSYSAISASEHIFDLETILEVLYPARLKWYNLGIKLGLDNTTLDCIKTKERDDCDACLKSMLQKVLDETTLTQAKIVHALESPLVQYRSLTNKIKRMTFLGTPSSLDNSSTELKSTPTPQCVSTYTSFLKDKYKQMSTLLFSLVRIGDTENS